MILALNITLSIFAVILLLYLLEKDLGLFLLSFMLLIQYIWMFFSISVIETGIFINEQGRNGYFTFSGVVLLLFYISTLIALIFYKKWFGFIFKNFKTTTFKLKPFNESSLSIILIGFIMFLAYLNLLSSPIPLFDENVSKFNFWETAKYPQIRSLVGNVMGFVGFGAALLYRYNKKTSILYLVLYVLYLILLDQKFTGFLVAIYGILIALFFSSKNKIQFKLKWIFNKYLISIFVVLFALVYIKYSKQNPFKYIGLSPLESVFYRTFGLQAHVFWGTVEQYIFLNKSNTWNITELWKGMHLLMLEFWPWSYENYISVTTRGVSWTNAYPSILIRIFPLPLAVIVNMLLLSIVGVFQELLSKFIKNGGIILSIIFFQLLTWVNYAYTMAYFHKLIIPLALLCIYLFYKYIIFKAKPFTNA